MFGIELCLLNYALISIISILVLSFALLSHSQSMLITSCFPDPNWLMQVTLLNESRLEIQPGGPGSLRTAWKEFVGEETIRRLKRSLLVTSHCSSTVPLDWHDPKCKVHKCCRVHGEWAVGKQNKIIYMSYTRDVYRNLENYIPTPAASGFLLHRSEDSILVRNT